MKVTQMTDVGAKRDTNQDQVGSFKNKDGLQLMLLCDGMGGHNAGDVASEMALFQVGYAWEQEEGLYNKELIFDWIEDHIKAANERVNEKAKQYQDLSGMGTTMIATTLLNGEALIAHVGDSRVYKLTQNTLHLVTHDHSFVQELVDNQMITEEEAATHPQRNIVTRAIGTESEVDVEIQTETVTENDLLLLCSDGLSDMLSTDEITAVLMQHTDLDQMTTSLIEAANASGGKDNISVILVRVEGSDMP